MIPKFPKFKKVDLTDRDDIGSYLDTQHPYSSFNFTNFWAWDIRAERMISDLHGNLVTFFTDYKTAKPFLSFHGTHKPVNTIRELLQFSKENGGLSKLKFITHETVAELETSDLCIEEDRNNFDYIFSTSKLSDSKGSAFKTKRMLVKKFNREYPDAVFELKDLSDKKIQKQIVSVVRLWEHNKKAHNKSYDLEHEETALRRLLETATDHNLVLSCVSVGDTMIGFSIDEILPHKYAMAHFIKADNSYRGVYEFINEKVAQYLLSQHVEFWNWQQDLNIEGLRRLKLSYRPVEFLKKYEVSLNSNTKKG